MSTGGGAVTFERDIKIGIARAGAVTFERDIKIGIARAGAYGVPVYGSTRLTESASSLDKFAGTAVFYSALQPKFGGI